MLSVNKSEMTLGHLAELPWVSLTTWMGCLRTQVHVGL